MPQWVSVLAWISLASAFACALVVLLDILAGHRQHMWIMNLVWPITALYAGPLALWLYYRVGRHASHRAMQHMKHEGMTMGDDSMPHGESKLPEHRTQKAAKPFFLSVAVATTHCGSGCTVGDILVEGFLLPLFPLTLFGRAIFGAWVLDYIAAFVIGVAFQYFTIKPMRNLTPAQGLIAALKADSLSLTAWQIGMYGWMALVAFVFVGHEIDKASPTFWFMMLLAMLCGFATSYPVNWWLVRKGIKETM